MLVCGRTVCEVLGIDVTFSEFLIRAQQCFYIICQRGRRKKIRARGKEVAG